MSAVLLSKVVAALPGTLTADTVYFVRVGTGFDIYITNHTGTIVAYPQNGRVQVDIYGGPNTSGSFTWTKPSWAKSVRVIVVAPGAGGGSGRKGAAATARSGGSGGSGGSINEATFLASLLPATVPVVVRPGGAGGAAVSVNSTNGNPGATINGLLTSFGTSPLLVAAFGANPGLGGTNASVLGGTALASLATGGNGGATSVTATATAPNVVARAASGGGAGGSISTADVLLAGSAGAGLPGVVYGYVGPGSLGGASGGTVDGAAGTAGTDNASGLDFGAPAGGGAAPSKTATGGGKGGDGGWPGGAGGGGGASTDDQGPSGAGGKGANGMVMVISMG